jgi:hypothetical protein
VTPRRLLFGHFLRQHASFEGIATSAEAKLVVIAVVSLLAGPGYLAALSAAQGAAYRSFLYQGRLAPELWLWKQEWLLFAISLVTVGALVAIQWRSFVLGGRDYRILGLLPIRRRDVMSAKLLSLAAVVALLHVAINTLPGLWLPVGAPFGYPRTALALQAALLMQTVFAASAIVALQGLVSLLLRGAAARAASAAIQAVILVAAALLFVAEGAISRLAFAMRDADHLVSWLVPVVWFRGLYVELLGVDSVRVAEQARLAVTATLGAVAVAVPCSLLGFRDAADEGRRCRVARSWPRLAAGWHPARPVARGIAAFVSAAAFRSASAGLVARGLFLVGVALTLSGFMGLALREMGRSAPVIPAEPLIAPVFVLPFFATVALRLAAVYPADLEANWLFRLTEATSSNDYAAGIRHAALAGIVLPLLALAAVPYAAVLGVGKAAALLALALAVALATVEWMFLGFAKVPFTCTYQPGKARLRVTWPKYAAIFAVYCALLPTFAARLLANPPGWAATLAALLVSWRVLAARRDRQARAHPLVFDDAPSPSLTLLNLERPSAVRRPAGSVAQEPRELARAGR